MARHFWYVYILESEAKPGSRYIGCTEDLKRRVAAHNSGNCRSTAPLSPWRLATYHAFSSKDTAYAFERYLKTASGKAFYNKRLR